MNPKMKAKREGESRIDFIDFSDRLRTRFGTPIADETIESSTVVEVGTSDLTITDLDPVGSSVRYLVSGGSTGQEYTVQAEAITSEDQILRKRKTFKVV